MSHLNDAALVREQYTTEKNLQARQALWREMSGGDPLVTLWDSIVACNPRHVLEVGGGEGKLAARVRDELGADVTLVDLSPRMVEVATERGVRAQVADVQELPFEDASFDTVLACWMLYHVPDLDRGLAEIARVLEPGGKLVANTNSRDHCRELYELIDYPTAMRENVFRSENGEESLSRHFSHVERHDVVARATVRDRQTLVDYSASLMVETNPVPEDVELPFIVDSSGTVFVAIT
jgi:SAM-dependent methyltransferase